MGDFGNDDSSFSFEEIAWNCAKKAELKEDGITLLQNSIEDTIIK